ncbi:hypothetical protein EVAR_67777_1 [Eumeta japonica]|uniref:Uncharacterized protein n=1 Tax=Eumeta variegata TaxID=151549 RepID=A0A4C1ZYH5_EUMVA|nr:hypothetical protein EVAR_67777_1 [Eumeta japonica]
MSVHPLPYFNASKKIDNTANNSVSECAGALSSSGKFHLQGYAVEEQIRGSAAGRTLRVSTSQKADRQTQIHIIKCSTLPVLSPAGVEPGL